MAERPDRDEAAEPDRPEGASETPSADAWSDAVDHPHDGLQDSPTGPADLFDGRADRPRMGFSGGAPAGSREPAPRDPSTMTTTTISASWGRCSSSCSAGADRVCPISASWSASSAERGPRRSAARHRGADAPAGRRRGLAGAGDAIQQMWKQMGIDLTDSRVMAMLEPDEADVRRPDPEARMEMSTDVARKTVASETDPTVTAAQQREVDDAVHVANLWVDPVTTLPAPNGKGSVEPRRVGRGDHADPGTGWSSRCPRASPQR